MRLFRTAASVALTAMLASTVQAQSRYYGPLEAFPAYGAYASTPDSQRMPTRPYDGAMRTPPVNHATPAPAYNGPGYAWGAYPTYPAVATNPERPDLGGPTQPVLPQASPTPPTTPGMPLPPSPAPYGYDIYNENTLSTSGLSAGLMEQMLAESSAADQAVIAPIAEPTLAVPHETVDDFVSMSDAYGETACGACGQYLPGCCSPWYMSISTVVLGRNKPNKLWTSYRSPAPMNATNLLRNTHDTGFEWQWGNEIRFGRRFADNQWALEVQYWTLYPMEGDVRTTDAAGVNSAIDIAELNFNASSGAEWFDNALEHRLRRRDEVHNIELNLIRFASIYANPDARWSSDWSMGLRYFRFQEQLTFSSRGDPARAFFVANPGFDTRAVLNDRITNSLFGFQVGCDVDYRLFSRWRLFAKPQIGIYNNHINHEFHAYLGDGTAGVPSAASGQPGTYPVRSSVDAVSFITQLDLGVDWQIGGNWSAQGGYRVMVATGIGLSDHQIPDAIVNINELADIDRNGELILHGAFFDVTYDY